ncbi:MFS transporter [Thermosipho atlanticus]|uniref:Predicted arabinose efflux permease, MFS family n=1 Tax=Thermosipho atlanticus DSM 15807 TaxID=1123380 RepID=A0A1M5RXX6_9BACT|nr:MFS transporter [Thermosipho atlanticus]SHH31034.1 Predicted arabinose efflux permease, MFS family [Thermosipho atlanticus DSM 15807]
MRGYFHKYHVFSNIFSILAYLLSSFINSTAARMNLSYSIIGAINFVGATSYVVGSLSFGHIGDKFGHKKFIFISTIIFSIFIIISLQFSGIVFLFFLAIVSNLFFGSFYPQIEGLIAKSESSLKIDHSKITMRFNLSWSSGNILGMAFGPFLTVKTPYLIFWYGILLNLISSFIIWRDYNKNGDKIHFIPARKLINEKLIIDFPNIRKYRRAYRLTLFFSGLLYTSILSLFPKVISLSGISLSFTGFIIVFANIAVFFVFIVLGKINIWAGRPKISFLFLLVLPITSVLMFLKMTPVLFVILSFLGGMCYAIPYTFAIFYGLSSQENDQGKQGGFHEATIGMLFGFGPLIGGFFLDIFQNMYGLGIMGIILSIIVTVIQIKFIKSLNL